MLILSSHLGSLCPFNHPIPSLCKRAIRTPEGLQQFVDFCFDHRLCHCDIGNFGTTSFSRLGGIASQDSSKIRRFCYHPTAMPVTPRLRSACDACHQLKVRCSGYLPCDSCTESCRTCVFSMSNRLGRPLGSKNKRAAAAGETSSGSTSNPALNANLMRRRRQRNTIISESKDCCEK